MHLRTHVRPEHRGRYTHGDSEYIDGMIEHDDTIGTHPQGARRDGHRRRHDRRLHHRQRPAHEHLAGRRDDAVPLGEEHQLGRRLPRAVPGALARPHQARHGHQRADEPQRLDSDAVRRSPASPTSSARAQGRLPRQRHRLQGAPRRLRPVEVPRQPSAAPSAPHNDAKSARDTFFYTDDDGLLVAHAAGRLQVRLRRAAHARARWASGPSRSPRCACRRSST